MKKLKIALIFLILVALFVVVYQNREFFLTTQMMSIDLTVWGYTTPPIAHGLYFLGCFLVGFLLAYTASLMPKFRSSKMVKELNAVIDSQQEKISTLRGEMDLLKRRSVVEVPAAEETNTQPEMKTAPEQN